jgi:hypothetical protein
MSLPERKKEAKLNVSEQSIAQDNASPEPLSGSPKSSYVRPKLVDAIPKFLDGDIIAFGPRFDIAKASLLTKFLQGMIKTSGKARGLEHGQVDTTHMGFIRVEVKDGKEILKIVHVTERKEVNGYVSEPFENALAEVGGDRAARLYRIADPAKRKLLAEFVADEKLHEGTTWSKSAAFYAGSRSSTRKGDKSKMHKETVCSGFVADCLIHSGTGVDFGKTHPITIPSVVEEILASAPGVESLIFPGTTNLYEAIYNAVCDELIQMAAKAKIKFDPATLRTGDIPVDKVNTDEVIKFLNCLNAFKQVTRKIETTYNKLDTLDKTLMLLQNMFEPLKMHTGIVGAFTSRFIGDDIHKYPGALERVLNAARARRVFLVDIENFKAKAAIADAKMRATAKPSGGSVSAHAAASRDSLSLGAGLSLFDNTPRADVQLAAAVTAADVEVDPLSGKPVTTKATVVKGGAAVHEGGGGGGQENTSVAPARMGRRGSDDKT